MDGPPRNANALRATRLAVACAIMLGLIPATLAAAQPFKVCVVDEQAVLEKTKAGKRALGALKEFAAGRQRIISSDDEELKRFEKELGEQGSDVSEDTKREKQQMFQVKLERYQRRYEEFNREIQMRQKEIREEYQKKIAGITSGAAEKAGCSAVIEKGSESTIRVVIYSHRGIDLTDGVIKEFDRKYQK